MVLVKIMFDFRVANIEQFWNKQYTVENKKSYQESYLNFVNLCTQLKKE